MKTAIDNKLPVMESFYTLQGEGFFTGHPAYFIRLSGCDVGCVWCDVKESWEIEQNQEMEIEEIVKLASKFPSRLAVITGGEPLMHDLTNLTKELKNNGFKTNIETSGVYKVTGEWDWICFSPKKFKKPDESIFSLANELKVIINHKSDFEFAEEHKKNVHSNCKLYLQVEWTKREKLMPQILDYIKENPEWNLSLQTHKYLDIP